MDCIVAVLVILQDEENDDLNDNLQMYNEFQNIMR